MPPKQQVVEMEAATRHLEVFEGMHEEAGTCWHHIDLPHMDVFASGLSASGPINMHKLAVFNTEICDFQGISGCLLRFRIISGPASDGVKVLFIGCAPFNGPFDGR